MCFVFLTFLFSGLLVLYTDASYIVCDNYESYAHPDTKHCFKSYDDELNVVSILEIIQISAVKDSKLQTEIVQSWGFTVDEFHLYTDDGYRINVMRVYDKIYYKNPLVLGHGVATNTISWVFRRKTSIGKLILID